MAKAFKANLSAPITIQHTTGPNLFIFQNDLNGNLEIGRQDGTASTPYIDFHSGATATDFDARIIASGGTGTSGGGTLNFVVTNLTKGSVAIPTISSTDTLSNKTISATGQITSTLANNTANGGGQIYLNGNTGNRIDFSTAGTGAPTFTTRSTGTKIVLYPQINAAAVDYAIGIENLSLWQSVLDSTGSFKWYAGTTQVASLSGAGVFSAVSKSLDIPHPTKPDMRLRYGSLEGPENGVYVRGNTKENIIELPEVWTGLVDESTITVSLTSVGKFQKVYVEKIENNKIYIGGRVKEISYLVFGERKDIDKITVEY